MKIQFCDTCEYFEEYEEEWRKPYGECKKSGEEHPDNCCMMIIYKNLYGEPHSTIR